MYTSLINHRNCRHRCRRCQHCRQPHISICKYSFSQICWSDFFFGHSMKFEFFMSLPKSNVRNIFTSMIEMIKIKQQCQIFEWLSSFNPWKTWKKLFFLIRWRCERNTTNKDNSSYGIEIEIFPIQNFNDGSYNIATEKWIEIEMMKKARTHTHIYYDYVFV